MFQSKLHKQIIHLNLQELSEGQKVNMKLIQMSIHHRLLVVRTYIHSQGKFQDLRHIANENHTPRGSLKFRPQN